MKYRFSSDQILYGKLRPYLAKIARPNFNGVCSTDILPIEPGPFINRDYLCHFLSQPSLISLANARATGANLPRLSPTELGKFAIPIPPLVEQRRIAEVLDRVDALRAKRRTSIALINDLAQSIFLDMFGDAFNFKGETLKLSDVVRIGTVVTYGIVQAGDEFPGGVPYIRTGDIVDGTIATARLRHTDPAIAARFQRSRVSTNDIVMSIRATVGATALVPQELDGANLTQGTARISPGESINHTYLLHYLRSQRTQEWIQRQVKGATFREITLARLRELPVIVPAGSLQKEFAHAIEHLEVAAARCRTHLEHLDALFASIQSRVFRGELWQDDLKEL